ALFRRPVPAQDSLGALPGAPAFMAAARTVSVLRWALSSVEQERMVLAWRARLEGGWTSPFTTATFGPQGEILPVDSARARAAALLTADFLYRTRSPGTLAAIARAMPGTATWDEVFQAALPQLPLMVEAQAAQEAGIPGGPTPNGVAGLERSPVRAEWLHRRPANENAVFARVSGSPYPVLVQVSGETTSTGQQHVPLECAPARSEIDIQGEWLQVGYRLRATHISIQHLGLPLSIDAAPPDTIAYLQEAEGERGEPAHLVALRSDGSTVRIADLGRPASAVSANLMRSIGSPPLLLEVRLAGCIATWLIHADPLAGTADWWLMPQSERVELVWRPDRGDILRFQTSFPSQPGSTAESTWQYMQLTAESGTPISQQTELPAEFWPWGWSAALQRLVVMDQVSRVGLVDLDGAEETIWYDLYGEFLWLAPPGSTEAPWFVYVARTGVAGDDSSMLRLLNLATGSDTLLLQSAEGEGFGWPAWSPNPDAQQLVVAVGPVTDDPLSAGPLVGPLLPMRLLVVRPDQPGFATVATEFAEDERLISPPVVCADGSLLYTVAKNSRAFTRLHAPGSKPLVVGEPSQRPLFPRACPGPSPTTSRGAH
ncbi:MAG TPA: hypothetical protein VER55_11610, partial [Ardenticatenaceae bacterium]|nr:hypothetical protein [Ardenticatenaceae bacterium]